MGPGRREDVILVKKVLGIGREMEVPLRELELRYPYRGRYHSLCVDSRHRSKSLIRSEIVEGNVVNKGSVGRGVRETDGRDSVELVAERVVG
jgi:hypothetical protein